STRHKSTRHKSTRHQHSAPSTQHLAPFTPLPELPDVVVYLEALDRHVVDWRLERITLLSPFVLRSVDPPLDAIAGRVVRGVRRVGKRVVLVFDDETFLVLHLM